MANSPLSPSLPAHPIRQDPMSDLDTFQTAARSPHHTDQFATSPRHLADGGDNNLISDHLRTTLFTGTRPSDGACTAALVERNAAFWPVLAEWTAHGHVLSAIDTAVQQAENAPVRAVHQAAEHRPPPPPRPRPPRMGR
ncbi:hypothetical protein OK074_4996 [Actinobacteria bacterium OK074]|nr:hypothetical protein OK074_4996 [Actinobacteria bacterium OK074]